VQVSPAVEFALGGVERGLGGIHGSATVPPAGREERRHRTASRKPLLLPPAPQTILGAFRRSQANGRVQSGVPVIRNGGWGRPSPYSMAVQSKCELRVGRSSSDGGARKVRGIPPDHLAPSGRGSREASACESFPEFPATAKKTKKSEKFVACRLSANGPPKPGMPARRKQ